MPNGQEDPLEKTDVDGKLDFTEELDVYLTILQAKTEDEKKSDGAKDLVEVSNRLISYQALLARANTTRAFFALKHPSVTEISGTVSLQEYAQRDPKAIAKRGQAQALTVYSVRQLQVDLKGAFSNIEEPSTSINNKKDPKFDRTFETPEYESALKTQTSIPMDKISKASNPLNLEEGDWQKVTRGNELLCGFAVDTEQVIRLRKSKLSDYLPSTLQYSRPGPNATAIPATQPGVTKAGLSDPLSPVSRATRPVFVLYVKASSQDNKSNDMESTLPSPGSFWSHAKSVATTNIIKVTDSLSQWSVYSGMSSKTVGGGLSVPLGEKATVGAKFGFTREKSHEESFENQTDIARYTVTHDVPTALININETTVQLSSDAEKDIRKLRKERNFSDLLSFFDKYGTIVFQNVTLGGRLYHTQSLDETNKKSQFENEESLKKSANASLSIPDVVELGAKYSSENTKFEKQGTQEFHSVEYLSWNGIGGNPSLSVDPPKWRESLSDHTTWKPIQYDNPVRLDEFIGRIAGFSDVPVLFATILASGVLNPSVLALPPQGLSSQDKKGFKTPYLGIGVLGRTGAYAKGADEKTDQKIQWSDIAPVGFSWDVFRSNRDIKREILANFQSTFNVAANLPHVAPFLQDLVVEDKTFTVMFRWLSVTRKATWDPAEKTKALEAVPRDDTADKEPILSGNCYLGTLTYRAWMIGLWRVQRHNMSSTDFEALRLEVSKFFSEPRLLEEGCDWLSSLAERASAPHVSFQLYASDGLKGEEVLTKPWTDSKHAFNAFDRRLRLSSLHFLPVSGEVELYPQKDNKNIPVTPPMSEAALMQLQEASAVITFVKGKLARLTDAIPKEPAETAKAETKTEWDKKHRNAAEIVKGLEEKVKEIESRLETDRVELLFNKEKSFDPLILPQLDDIEAKVLELEEN